MGPDLGATFAAIDQELSHIHLVWGQYKILFGTKESRVALLNEASGSFFRIVQDGLFENVLLAISRLTDRPAIAGHQTLTVQRLADLIPDATLAAQVRAKVAIALQAEDFCRDWRNNRIGHNNLQHRLNPTAKPLKEATRLKVEAVLAALAQVVNTVALHYTNGTTAYSHVLPSHPDAEGLLYVIHDGLKAEKERRKRFDGGDFSIDDHPYDL